MRHRNSDRGLNHSKPENELLTRSCKAGSLDLITSNFAIVTILHNYVHIFFFIFKLEDNIHI